MKKTKHPGIYYRTNKDGSRTYYLRIKSRSQQTWLAVGRKITDAKELRNKIKVEQAEGKLGVIRPKKYTFRELADEYWKYYTTKGTKRNWDRVRSLIKQLNSHFRNIEISNITPWTIEHYIRKRKEAGKKPKTINTELDYLRAILNKGAEWGMLHAVPKIKGLPLVERRARILSAEELEYILDNVSQDHRDAILIALDTGMRLGEILRLGPENLDLKNNLIKLDDTKSKKPRDIPLTARAKEIIERRLLKYKGKLFKYKSGNRMAGQFTYERQKLTEISPWRFHDLRHNFITKLIQEGIDPYTVMELAGHSKLEMVTRYLHTNEEKKREAIGKLEDE